MRNNRALIVLVFLIACNQQQKGTGEIKSKESAVIENTEESGEIVNKDSLLLSLTKRILMAIKEGDYQRFADFVHPELGVRFSPYGYIDTTNHVKLSPAQFLQQVKNEKEIIWGSYDGTGKAIILPIKQYFEAFVYDVDFLNAEKTSLNEIIGRGNSLNNLKAVYAGSDFIEKYFSGFNKKYEGMDWRSLRLVFQAYKGKPFLVAIVHDQWTI